MACDIDRRSYVSSAVESEGEEEMHGSFHVSIANFNSTIYDLCSNSYCYYSMVINLFCLLLLLDDNHNDNDDDVSLTTQVSTN